MNEELDRRVLLGAVGLASVAAFAAKGGAAGGAGPLNPPAGAVTGTGKTLTSIEPRTEVNSVNTPGDGASVHRIAQPGSYYLSANVLGIAGRHGIVIAASNVTLDLNGFCINGQANAATLNGVDLEGAPTTIVVRNGLVVGWGGNGIDLNVAGASPGKRVESIVARDNLGHGINGQDSVAVIGCTAVGNGGVGIAGSSACTFISCVSRGNQTGFSGGSACTVIDCAARVNDENGIVASTGSTVRSCAAQDNGGHGFLIGGASAAHGCTSTENHLDGFQLSSDAAAYDCTATDNLDSGFTAGSACTLSGCRANNNGLHGFDFSTGCRVVGNAAFSNGVTAPGAGFFSDDLDSRIEGNSSRGSDYGYWITGSRNVLIGNSSAGATTRSWELAASNIYGAIVDRSAAATAAVSGPSAASVLGTTDPHANITH